MTLKKLLLAIAGGLGVLGALLPWYKVSIFGVSVNSTAFQMGALYVILAILAILCGAALIALNVLKEKQIKSFIKFKSLDKLPLFVGIALAAIAVIAFIAIKVESSGLGGTSFGIWLLILAGAAAIVLPLLKNVEPLEKTVIGKPEKPAAKDDKKPAKK